MAATDIKIILSAEAGKAVNTLQRVTGELGRTTSAAKNLGYSLAGVSAAVIGVNSAVDAFQKTVNMMDDFKKSTISIAATLTDTIKAPGRDLKAVFENNLKYAEQMYAKIEIMSREFFATGEEMVQAWEMLSQKGVTLVTDKDIRNLGVLVDQIKVATKGQNTNMQIAQEIRSIMAGQSRMTDTIAMKLKNKVGNDWEFKLNLELEKGQGAALQWIASQMQGMAQASDKIAKTFENQATAMGSMAKQIMRTGLTEFYEDIVRWLEKGNAYLIQHKNEIAGGVARGYQKVKEIANGIYDFIVFLVDNKATILAVGELAVKMAAVAVSMKAIAMASGAITSVFGAAGVVSKFADSFMKITGSLGSSIGGKVSDMVARALYVEGSGIGDARLAINAGRSIGSKIAAGITYSLNVAGAILAGGLIGWNLGQALLNYESVEEFADYVTAALISTYDTVVVIGKYIGTVFIDQFIFIGTTIIDVMKHAFSEIAALGKNTAYDFSEFWVTQIGKRTGSKYFQELGQQMAAERNANRSSGDGKTFGGIVSGALANYKGAKALGGKGFIEELASVKNITEQYDLLRKNREREAKAAQKPLLLNVGSNDPDAESPDTIARELMERARKINAEIGDNIAKASMDAFAYDLYQLNREIQKAKVGDDLNNPMISDSRENALRDWQSRGMPSGKLSEMDISARKEQIKLLDNLDTYRVMKTEEIENRRRESERKTIDAIIQERERMEKSIADMQGTRLDKMREAVDYELAQEKKRINGIKVTTTAEIQAKKALLDDYAEYARKKRSEVELATSGNWGAGMAAGFKEFGDQLKSGFEYAKDLATSTAQAMSQSFGDFFFDVMTGKIKKLSDYITGFLTSIARAMANVMGEMAARQLISGAMGYFSGGTSTAAPVTGANGSSITMTQPNLSMSGAGTSMANTWANGGLIEGGFKAFASGGIASKPTLGLVGEGRYNEAIVPLPDGKALPVVMRGGTQAAAPKVTINVINQTGQQANARASQPRFDGLGNMVIDVVLDALNRNVNGFRDAVSAV